MLKYALPLVLALSVGCKDGGEDTDDVMDLNAISNPDSPTKRSEILAAPHEGTNQIMIFGGNEGPVVNQIPTASFMDETWIFEPGVGWTMVPLLDSHPKKRGRYAIEVDEAGNRALMFGGRFRRANQTGDYELFDELWEFDFLTHEWTLLDEGGGPQRRYYPATGWDPETQALYVWGGNLNEDPLNFIRGNDLWKWQNGEWTEIPTSGNEPSPRVFFGSTFDPVRKRIVMFGGHPGDFVSQAYNQTFALDVETGEWTRLAGGNGAPSTRMHAHLNYDADADRYLLFGGHTDVGDQNDLWEFDIENNEWIELHIADTLNATGLGCAGNSSEVPKDYVTEDVTAPERRHRGMYAQMHGSLWVALGIHAECSDQVDDTWRYDIAGDTWHELIEATTGESCARRGDDCECLCI